jgi:hypothetical protein
MSISQLTKASPSVISELYPGKAAFVKPTRRNQLSLIQFLLFLSKNRHKRQNQMHSMTRTMKHFCFSQLLFMRTSDFDTEACMNKNLESKVVQ